MIAVADTTIVTGSFNFSHNATYNAENVIRLDDQTLAAANTAYIDALITLRRTRRPRRTFGV